MAQVSDDDLGMLVWCAMDYDRRLPHGNIPSAIWEKLSPEWQAKISRWKNNPDPLGAEKRRSP